MPALWALEVANVLGVAERRGRLTRDKVADLLMFLQSLPLDIAASLTLAEAGTILGLMRQHRLTAYDATYLELAQRLGLPLATKHRELIAVASTARYR